MEIRQGYKQTEVGIIPEEWEVKKLGECFEFLSTNSYSREKMTYEEQEYMNIHYGDIHMKYGATLDIEKMKGKIPYIKAEETLPKKIILVEEGDLLVADASEDYKDIGKSTEILNIKDNKVLGGLHTLLLRDKNNSFANGYKGYILRNEKILKEVKRIAAGISVLGISKTNLSELNIPIPPLKEQEKIADILSHYDKAIEQQELLIEKEKEFKKGMMQKIFSQEIRFKDDNGEDYPEGEEKRLGDIGELIDGDRGKNYPNENDIQQSGILFLSTVNFYNNRLIFTTGDKFITEEKFNQLKKGKVTHNDLIITLRGSIGNVILFENKYYDTAFINAQMMIIRPLKINKYYLYFILQDITIQKIFEKISSGSAQPQLTKKDLVELLVKIPSLKEQEKIANFLSNIDNKIELLENKLELLKNEKKGMMQKLLTGEVRV